MEGFSKGLCNLLAVASSRIPDNVEVRIPLKYVEVGPLTYEQRYPSGQRGWDEVPVRSASQVRILPSAPLMDDYPNRHCKQ